MNDEATDFAKAPESPAAPERRKLSRWDRGLLGAVLLLQIVVIVLLAGWFWLRNAGTAGPGARAVEQESVPERPAAMAGSALNPAASHGAAADCPGYDDTRFVREMEAMFAHSRARLRTMEAEMQRMTDLDGGWDGVGLAPSMDVQVRGSNYVILLSLPGVDPTNLNVSVDGRLLSVRATSRVSSGHSSGYQTMERRLMLPYVPGEGEAVASFSNGLLRVCMPVKQ